MLDTVRSFAIRWLLEPTRKVSGLVIHKTDGNGTYVAGAVIELDFNDNINADEVKVTGAENVVVYVNDASSALVITTGTAPIMLDGVLPGRYYLYEMSAPNGHHKADSMGFTLSADGNITLNYDVDTILVNKNELEVIDSKIQGIRFVVCTMESLNIPLGYERKEVAESCGMDWYYTATPANSHDWETITKDKYTQTYNNIIVIKIYDRDNYAGYYTLIRPIEVTTFKGTADSVYIPYCGTDNVAYNGLAQFPEGVHYSYDNTRKLWTSDSDQVKSHNLIYPNFPSNISPELHADLSDRSSYKTEQSENTWEPAISCYDDYSIETELDHMPPSRAYNYIKQGCAFNPKATIGSGGPDADGYYYDTTYYGKTYLYKPVEAFSAGDSIAISGEKTIVSTTQTANYYKSKNYKPYNWTDKQDIITSSSSEWDRYSIPIDLSAYTDYADFDPDNISDLDYVYYGDGLTAEKMAEYTAAYKQGSIPGRDIVVELEK